MKLIRAGIDLIGKFREIILYGIFGCMTTLVNWVSYIVLVRFFTVTTSNITAWTIAMIFAFFVNKLFVFKSKSRELRVVLREALSFLSMRILSGVVEMVGPTMLIWMGIDGQIFGVEGSAAKAIVSVFVIIMNFLLSKLVVFRKKQ